MTGELGRFAADSSRPRSIWPSQPRSTPSVQVAWPSSKVACGSSRRAIVPCLLGKLRAALEFAVEHQRLGKFGQGQRAWLAGVGWDQRRRRLERATATDWVAGGTSIVAKVLGQVADGDAVIRARRRQQPLYASTCPSIDRLLYQRRGSTEGAGGSRGRARRREQFAVGQLIAVR